jgi:hypothetical protein
MDLLLIVVLVMEVLAVPADLAVVQRNGMLQFSVEPVIPLQFLLVRVITVVLLLPVRTTALVVEVLVQ